MRDLQKYIAVLYKIMKLVKVVVKIGKNLVEMFG